MSNLNHNTSGVRELSWEQFESEFKPLKNTGDSNASLDGCMFETFDKDLEYVTNRNKEAPGTVWTFMDDGSDGTFIGDGMHYVNRLGYVVTELPAIEGIQYVVDRESSQFRNFYICPSCGHEWQDEWSSTCNDDCPKCGQRHISPDHSEELL